jgi:hypothetical protein
MPALNIPLKPLEMEELRRLTHIQGPCITLQVPDAHPGASDVPRTALLRQLTQQAVESLGHFSTNPHAASLAPALKAFVETVEHAGGPGFTILVAPEFQTVFATPGVRASATVSGHFQVLPLITAAASPEEFYALGLSRNIIRLWRVTPASCEEVALPHSVPASLEAARSSHPDHSVMNRSTVGAAGTGHAKGKMSSMSFGTVSEYDSEAEYLHHFFGAVAKGLRDVAQAAPVFLIGTRPDILEYRRAAHGANLFESEWHRNPAHCTVAEVEKEARLAAPQEVQRNAEAALRQLPEIRDKIMGSSEAILKAASEGRIRELFVAEEAAGKSGAPAHQPGENPFNASAVETLRTGGKVFVLPGETLALDGAPDGCSIAATLRY